MNNSEKYIRLSDAIICADLVGKKIRVLINPDNERIRDRYALVFGACDPYWSECETETLIGEMLLQLWQICVFYNISPKSINEEMNKIAEYREIMETN